VSIESFVFRMPKVELHVHLEGCLRPATLLSLAQKNGVALPADDEAGVRKWLRVQGAENLAPVQDVCSHCVREPEDFHLLALDFLAEQAMQNILYSEVHFSVSTHAGRGIDMKAVFPAIQQAIEDGEKRHGIKARLILEIMRDASAGSADETLEWALAGKDKRIVALGLSRSEGEASPFREHFQAAAEAGLHRVAHAGARRGPESIREVMDVCQPERIGHGISVAGDEELVLELIDKGVSLELGPTDWSTQTLDPLFDARIQISVNSDRPQLFQTNLTREYLGLHRTLGFSKDQLIEISLAGLRQAFLAEGERAALQDEFRRRLDHL
jgi:adenosine deaminase